ncbi:MAG: hypothetical protein ACRDBO_00130 [Lachnospiraceae bacterium]
MEKKAPVQLITLTEDRLEELMKAAGEAGANAAMQKASDERKAHHKKVVDKRLHNTKLLLKNYHMLKLNMKCSVYSKSQMRESAVDILNGMMNLYDDEVIIDSIKRSSARTAIIVTHIDTMLGLYEAYCNKSQREIDRRRYDVIFNYYISGKMLSVKEISLKINQSVQTVYDDLKAAEERLTALIFGIDGLKLK